MRKVGKYFVQDVMVDNEGWIEDGVDVFNKNKLFLGSVTGIWKDDNDLEQCLLSWFKDEYLIEGEVAHNKLMEMLHTEDFSEDVKGYFLDKDTWVAFHNVFHTDCWVEEFDTLKDCLQWLEN